jgi:hypothetical protein
MFCDQVVELFEPIAAGDLVPDEGIARHLASCVHCAEALAGARRVDQLLRARTVPAPSTQFTSRTLARIRRDRWRREQFFDAGFNVATVTVIGGVVLAVWMIIDAAGCPRSAATCSPVRHRDRDRRPADGPTVSIHSATIPATALAIWWWAGDVPFELQMADCRRETGSSKICNLPPSSATPQGARGRPAIRSPCAIRLGRAKVAELVDAGLGSGSRKQSSTFAFLAW